MKGEVLDLDPGPDALSGSPRFLARQLQIPRGNSVFNCQSWKLDNDTNRISWGTIIRKTPTGRRTEPSLIRGGVQKHSTLKGRCSASEKPAWTWKAQCSQRGTLDNMGWRGTRCSTQKRDHTCFGGPLGIKKNIKSRIDVKTHH